MNQEMRRKRLVEVIESSKAAAENGQAKALLGVWGPQDKVRFLDTLRLDPQFREAVRELLARE